MAGTSVLKLKVDDKEYNSSLKQAQQGMQHLEQALKDAGKSFTQVDKSVVDYVRGIGQMEAQSKTARGRINEMSSAFVELSLKYNKMSDDVKSSDVGKALSESMEQLKQRTVDAKNELEGLTKALNNVKMPEVKEDGQFGGGKFDDMFSVFGGNLMTKGAEAIGQLVSQMGDLINEGVDLAVAGEGIRNAFERLDNPQLLDGLRQATHGTVTDIELMKAAVKFDDFNLPVEELGTMLAFAQQKAKDTGQSVDYMVDSIVTGLGRKSLMILDNLGLSATEVKEKMAETGDMTKAVGAIIREQMSKAGGYVETAADRAAQATVSQQNAMEALGRELMPLKQGADSAFAAIQTGALQATAFLVRNKEAVLAVATAIGTYIAVTKAHTAAIWLQQKAQLAFNAAAKTNPYGLIAAAAAAAITAIISFTDKTKEATETQKAMAAAAERTKKAQADAANTVSSSVGNVLASYQSLQTEWKTLKSEQEKNAFIKENADKFRDMGLAVNSAADAENVLVKNTSAVVKALEARATAEAWGEIYKERLKKKIENDANPSVENGRKIYSVRNDLRGREYRAQFSDEEKAYVYSHYQGRERDVIQAAGINSDSWSVMAARTEVERLVREYRNALAAAEVSGENQRIQEASDNMTKTAVEARKAAAELSKLVPTTTKPTGGNGTKQQTELQQNNALIEQLTQQYIKLSDAEKTASDEQHLSITAQKAQLQSQIGMLQQRNAEIQRYTAQAKNTPAFAINAQGLPALNDQLKQLRQAQSEAASLDVWRTYEQQIANVENRIAELTGKLATGRQATITIPVDADTETLTEQLKKVTDVTADDKTVTITADTQSALDKVLELTDQVEGRTLTIKVVATTDATATKLTDTNLGAFTSDLKKQIANAELGSELYNQLTSRLADTTALSTVIQTALKNGVDLSTVSDQMQGVWQQILGNVDVPDNAIEELVRKLNEQLAEADIKPIKIDVKTGNLSGTAKEVGKNWQAAANAVQQVGSALQQIEDPAAKVVGIIAQAIATVAQGFASALARPESQTGGVWGWIAAAAAGTATMISTIASIKSATSGGFANGGIVPGNSFNDQLRTSDYGISSGELILNRAQQGVIADALSSDNPSGNGGTGGQPYVMGETVYLGVNNHLRRNGQGEIVTTSMLRKRGIL